MNILVLNSGSSSQKSTLYQLDGATEPDLAQPTPPLWAANIEWDSQSAVLSVSRAGGSVRRENIGDISRKQAVEHLLRALWSGNAKAVSGPLEIDLVGHRIVHGGPKHRQPALVTPEVKAAIQGVSVFAPLHNRAELEGMECVESAIGPVPQIAVFDTGFHAGMPMSAQLYPIPYEWFERGVFRYGFHGINHAYCAARAARLLGRDPGLLKLVTCHLGNGCSLAAIRNGQSVDTTMGFTPLEGLMMGTRSGSVDPGILTYLMRTANLTGEQMDDLLNKQSGLLGISGVSSDMREILRAREAGDARARLAFEMFIHAIHRGIGAMAAVLGSIDALVFTAGIGEHSPEVRAAVCGNLSFLGVNLDATKNARPAPDQIISTSDSPVPVLVIRAEEDWAIACDCVRLARTAQNPSCA